MATLQSELNLPGALAIIGTSNVTILESPGGGVPENLGDHKLIQTDQAVRFDFNWTVQGWMVSLLNPNLRWELRLYYELLGGGEFNVIATQAPAVLNFGQGGTTNPYPPGTTSANFNASMQVNGNSVPDGIFDIVAVLRLVAPQPFPPAPVGPIAAFAEFGMVQYYRVQP